MKKITFLFLLFSFVGMGQNIQFSDPDLLTYLTTKLCVDTNGDDVYDADADLNNDGQIQMSEAQQVESFYFSTVAHNIQDLGGFENFSNLLRLYVTTIQVDHMDFSVFPLLQSLRLSSNIGSFVFNNPELTYFFLQNVAFANPLFDLTNLPNLEFVRIQSTHLTNNLIFGTHNNLQELRIYDGQFSTLNLSGMPALRFLNVETFFGTTLDISNCTLLEEFTFRYTDNCHQVIGATASGSLNKITFYQNDYGVTPSNLDIAFENQALTDIKIRGINSFSLSNNATAIGRLEIVNSYGTVDIANCSFDYISDTLNSMCSIYSVGEEVNLTAIEGIRFLQLGDISNNLPLDLSTVVAESLYITDCSLTDLNLKNGNALDYFYANESSIPFICVDADELTTVQNAFEFAETSPVIHPYCSFVPGGNYHELTGNVQLNLGSSCTTYQDQPVFNLKFSITDGTNTDAFHADNTNSYSYAVPQGNHTVTASVVDSDLWSVSPSTFDVSFPQDGAVYTQDFCISPLGTFNDVQVMLVPMNNARPGFEANYKLIYRNTGNTSLDGAVQLSFNDDIMNFVSALPNASSSGAGTLSWDYADLVPFETREIGFTMVLNGPMHPNFPLNGDDILAYNATVNPTVADETPFDNVFSLQQIVVNSYDPNTITCLEGNAIAPEKVGEYVHYVVRFENSGSASAVNVVVKTIMDTQKFDLNSLVPLHGSHDFYTEIHNGNELEFIFQNIELPFDDANNDGYVLFKIRTLPTLVTGEIFNGQASIYFDYNFPIITNNAATIVSDNLSADDVLRDGISIYPNPAESVLNIKSDTILTDIKISDSFGRLIKTQKPSSDEIGYRLDVKDLAQGIYFLTVQSENRTQTRRFIKN